MQRAWITGLTLAGVLGTGGAAFAGMSLTHTDGAAVEAQSPGATAGTMATSTATTYRVGDAGLVTLDSAGGIITITSIEPSTGWTVLARTNPGVHLELSLTDTVQVLQVTADLVDGHIVASLTSAGANTSVAPDPASAPAPAPATPVVLVPTKPAHVVATTAVSGSGTRPSTPSGPSQHERGEHEGGSDD
jgi:hypothetical protein